MSLSVARSIRAVSLPLRLGSLQSQKTFHSWVVKSSSTRPNYPQTTPKTTNYSSKTSFLLPRFQSTSSNMANKLKTGDTIPSGHFKYIPFSPELSSLKVCGNPIDLKTEEWKGKKIVLLGIPGAFTKTCSENHLPGFIEKSAELKSKGVSGVYCIASNDAFVMSAWGRTFGSNEHVHMISDTTLQWLEPAGLTVDLSSAGLGKRSARFAAIIDDLKVTYIGIEDSPGTVKGSAVEAVLAKL